MNNIAKYETNKVVFVCSSEPQYLNGIYELLDDKIEIIPMRLYHRDFYWKKTRFRLMNLPLNFHAYVKHIILKYYLVILNRNKLYNTFTETDFDIVHVNNGGYPGSLAAIGFVLFSYSLKFKKLLFVVNNLAVTRKHPLRVLDWPLDYLVKKRVTTFITASKFAGDRLKQVLGTSKVYTIPNAVVVQSKILKQDRLNDLFVVGMIGLLEKRKGHSFAIKSFKQAIAEIPNAVLLLSLIHISEPTRRS